MTKPYVNKAIKNSDHSQLNDLFRSAYIDSNGCEIIITEEMIQQACEALMEQANPLTGKNPKPSGH